MNDDARDEETARLGALGLATGCLVTPVLLTIAAIVSFFVLVNQPPPRGWERAPFPEAVEVGAVVVNQSEPVGLLEGCVFVALELSETEAREISEAGLAFFTGLREGRNGEELERWRETPLVTHPNPNNQNWPLATTLQGEPIFPQHLRSCAGDPVGRVRTGMVALDRSGAYYTTFNHGEGILYVIPSERLAIYAYRG